MIRVIVQRLYSGNSPFVGDNNHFHHLISKLIKEKYIFIFYTIFSIAPILIYSFLIKNFYTTVIFSVTIYLVIFVLLKKIKKIN
jgi:UDP-N-acetylmuramyl pentapeptide phosphotransferase/UDP-N-acetylglucosamine-1-phosphate transferase